MSARLVYPNSNLFIELAQQQSQVPHKKTQPPYLPSTTPTSVTTFNTNTNTTTGTRLTNNTSDPQQNNQRASILSPTITNSPLNSPNKSSIASRPEFNSPKTTSSETHPLNSFKFNVNTKDYTNDLFNKFEKATFFNQNQNIRSNSQNNITTNNNSNREMNSSSLSSVGNAVTEAR